MRPGLDHSKGAGLRPRPPPHPSRRASPPRDRMARVKHCRAHPTRERRGRPHGHPLMQTERSVGRRHRPRRQEQPMATSLPIPNHMRGRGLTRPRRPSTWRLHRLAFRSSSCWYAQVACVPKTVTPSTGRSLVTVASALRFLRNLGGISSRALTASSSDVRDDLSP